MYAINYHNAHAFDNASECKLYGPYTTIDEAREFLAKLVENEKDPYFKISETGNYAGFEADELNANDRDEDIACEIWAEIIPLTHMP
jgi:hypothetical protein